MLLTDSQAVRHVRFDWLECYHLNQAKPYEIQLRDEFSPF